MSFLKRLQFARFADVLGRITRSTPDHVRNLQAKRLRALVRHSRERSPYYRKRLSGVPEEIPLDRLPIMTKDEMRDRFDDLVTDRRLRLRDLQWWMKNDLNLGRWYLDRYAVCHTSGSQGAPLVIVQDAKCINRILATMAARGRPGPRPGIREGLRKLVAPTRIAAVTFRRGFYPSGITLEFAPEVLWPFARLTRLSSIQPDLVERLNELQPHVLSGYASVLEGLAFQADSLNLRNLEYVTNSSEQLSARARERIEKAFRAPVIDHYGTGECLQLADGCPQCGQLHINADWAILESVDDDYRPVPPGELGTRVLVTNLANWTQPFIRYEVGDRVALATDSGNCRNPLPRIERIDGREAELFWIRDGLREQFLSGVLFHAAADSLHEIREWRAIQRTIHRIELQVQLFPGPRLASEHVTSRLIGELRRSGLPPFVELHVNVVDSIDPDPRTGKMRRMVSEVGRCEADERNPSAARV